MHNLRFGPGLQGDASHRDLPLNEGRGRLVVDRGKGGDVANELIQKSRLQEICLLRDGWFLCQHNILGGRSFSGHKSASVTCETKVKLAAVLVSCALFTLAAAGSVESKRQ